MEIALSSLEQLGKNEIHMSKISGSPAYDFTIWVMTSQRCHYHGSRLSNENRRATMEQSLLHAASSHFSRCQDHQSHQDGDTDIKHVLQKRRLGGGYDLLVEPPETPADSAPAPFPPPQIASCFLESNHLLTAGVRLPLSYWSIYPFHLGCTRFTASLAHQLTCRQDGWPSIQDDGEDLWHEGNAHSDAGS